MKTFREYLSEISDKTKLSYLKKSDDLHRKHQEKADDLRDKQNKAEIKGDTADDQAEAENHYDKAQEHGDAATKHERKSSNYHKKVKTGLNSLKKKSYTVTGKQNGKDTTVRIPAESEEQAKEFAKKKNITSISVSLNKSNVKDKEASLNKLKNKSKEKMSNSNVYMGRSSLDD